MKKQENYRWAKGQIRKKIKEGAHWVSTLANVAAILKTRLPYFFWVGFYLVDKDRLRLGPFQGPPACMTLSVPGGVCAAAVLRGETILVEDVHRFPGHVACDSRSRSEIVVPILNRRGKIQAVLDVDGLRVGDFDKIDQLHLEEIAGLLTGVIPK